MENEYKVGQKVRITRVDGTDKTYGINVGDIDTIVSISDYDGVILKKSDWMYLDQIEPIKRGRPAKKIAKPKAEPKVLGYIIAYDPKISKTLPEVTKRCMDAGLTLGHIFEVTKEYEIVTTCELKEVKGGADK